jgi:hypothetical protein
VLLYVKVFNIFVIILSTDTKMLSTSRALWAGLAGPLRLDLGIILGSYLGVMESSLYI